tara:strand:- start:223 stop:462 length:240 start_codon:yes stop_codon:yes gene_type:complete
MSKPHDKGSGYYARANRALSNDTDEHDPLYKTALWNHVGEEKRDQWVPLMDMTEQDDDYQDPFQIAADMTSDDELEDMD